MANSRYVALTRSYFTNVVLPNQKQLCVPRSRSHQSYSKLTCPREVYKRLYNKLELFSCIHDNFWRSHMYDWNGAVMLITGGSKGIGAHIVRLGLEEGVKHVANLDIDAKSGLALQYELNQKYGDKDKVKFIDCDVTDEQQLIQKLQSILSNQDQTYVVINNADLLNDSVRHRQYDDEIYTNTTGLITSNLTALDFMRTDKNGKGGAIINISAAAALCPSPFTPENKATKHAVMTLSLGLGNDEFFRRSGVRVITVCYGATDAHQGNDMVVSEGETEPKFSTILQPFASQCRRTAAQAIIEIYKHGSSGSIWVAKENKPVEDITYVVKKSYSVVLEPRFTAPP